MYKMGRADLLLLLFQLYNPNWNRRFVTEANFNSTPTGQVAAAAVPTSIFIYKLKMEGVGVVCHPAGEAVSCFAAAACTNFKSQVGSASASELGAIFTPDWQVAAAGANFIVGWRVGLSSALCANLAARRKVETSNSLNWCRLA